MNKNQLLKEIALISESYVENPLLVGTTEKERSQDLEIIRETLTKRHENNPNLLLKEFKAATLILEANETYSKNMEQLEDVMSDLLSLKSYFAPHASKLPALTQGIDKALARMQEAENEITQRTNGLLGGIKGSVATRNEATDKELSPLDQFLFEFTTTGAEAPHYGGANGPGWRTLADYVTPAPSHAANQGGKIASHIVDKSGLAGKVGAHLDPASALLSPIKGAAKAAQLNPTGAFIGPPDGGAIVGAKTGILAPSSGGSIWAKVGAIFTKAGFMKLLALGVPMLAIYALYRWLKQRTVILNKIINFTMALAAMLKTLYRQSRVLSVELDKTKKVGEVASLSMDGAIRSSASRTKGVFGGFKKLFQNTKPEDFAEFMSVATFTQQTKELTIAEYLEIFSDPKMATAFGTSQIADLQQAKAALRALDSQVAAAAPPAGAPVPPASPVPPVVPVGAPPVVSPLVASLSPHDNVFAPGTPSSQEIATELQGAVAAGVLTDVEASQVVASIAALDTQIQIPANGAKLVGRLEGFLAEPGLERLREVIAMHFISGCTLLKSKRVSFAAKYPRVKGALGGSDLKTALAFRLFNVAAARAVMSAAQMQTLLTPLYTQAGLDLMAVEAMVPASDPKGLTESLVAKEIATHKKIKTEFKTLFLKSSL